MPTHLTEPSNRLTALCDHTVRPTNIFFIVPMSCNHESLGSQGVVLAHFAAAALRATTAMLLLATAGSGAGGHLGTDFISTKLSCHSLA